MFKKEKKLSLGRSRNQEIVGGSVKRETGLWCICYILLHNKIIQCFKLTDTYSNFFSELGTSGSFFHEIEIKVSDWDNLMLRLNYLTAISLRWSLQASKKILSFCAGQMAQRVVVTEKQPSQAWITVLSYSWTQVITFLCFFFLDICFLLALWNLLIVTQLLGVNAAWPTSQDYAELRLLEVGCNEL